MRKSSVVDAALLYILLLLIIAINFNIRLNFCPQSDICTRSLLDHYRNRFSWKETLTLFLLLWGYAYNAASCCWIVRFQV
jgi:hypothetical protein